MNHQTKTDKMNTAPKTAAHQTRRIDLRYGNVVAIRPLKGKLTKPSRSELRWFKAAVPTIGASNDEREISGGNPSAQA